ncbi:MAG: 50S ribosomal protein L18 [Deltaproteobacteria bacterium]|nr:50S ribosomal protein L18 [Deltaproteobacteria bacterium]
MITDHRRRKWLRRKKRIRVKVVGTPERPRMTVYRSARHIYAQVIDDSIGKTLVSASTVEKEIRGDCEGKKKMDVADKIGALIAERCLAKDIRRVVFDRNGYMYMGRVAKLASAAREKGLEF